MSRLFLFNPENDLALAHGKAQYTAPPNALLLHNAGAMLPIWSCNEGDSILTHNINSEWIESQQQLFEIPNISLSANNISELLPWGWSLNTCRQFSEYGVNSSLIPNETSIEQIRQISHRRHTIDVISQINYILKTTLPTPIEANNASQVLEFLHKHQAIYLKSPWSSSGRGVINTATLSEDEIIRRANGIIRRQGSVMCEKALDKIKDFAMLFYCDNNGVRFHNYSSFFNIGAGNYAGNIIGSKEFIINSITQYGISQQKLELFASTLCDILTKLIVPHYRGYLGVDMMVYNDNGKIEIAPCVEINLRMTMGVVASLWSQKHLFPNSHGVMKVEYSPIDKRTAPNNPPIIIDKKLKSGRISLIPPDDNFDIYITAQCD
ncbi:MAG: hypothetical protein II260_00170 [Muribaculaceae bacterium]|nr:hypothetical protein [Muribaculaceae bacterium]